MPIYTYTTIDDPLATNGTRAFGINASGQIVGTYQDNTGLHGFLLSGGTYTTLDDPLATKQSPFVDTEALGINDLGQIVGTYQDNTGGFHGFLLSGGTYTTIDVPSAATGETFVTGINATGQIVGTYADATGLHGFLHLPGNGLYATIDDPLATNGTQAFGINNMAVRAPQNHVGGRSRRWRRVREGGFEEAVQAGGILIGPDDLARGVDARGHGTKGGQGIVNGGVEAVEVKGFASGSQTAPLLVAPHACCGVVSNGCCDEVYNISNNNIINATSLGTVGLNWQFSGVGNFSGLGESDMLLRNSNTGGLEVYDISNNQITNAAFIGTVIGSHDLSAATAGGAAGLDYRLAPGTVVGFALAGGGTNWSLAQGIGGGKSDALQAGVYGTARSGPAYLAAALAYTNHWMSTDRFAFAGDHLSASFNAQSFGGRVEGGYRFATIYGGLTPYAAIQAQSFTRRLIMRATSPAAASGSPLIRAARAIPAANWAGASTACCCSTPRPRLPCARVSPGRTTGSAIPRSPPYSRRFRARASSSTARRRRRIPRSPPLAPNIASPTASCCSPNSTASSRPTPPPTPAPAPCDIRGDPAFSGATCGRPKRTLSRIYEYTS